MISAISVIPPSSHVNLYIEGRWRQSDYFAGVA
jgi:hypothetical protein